MSSRERRRSSSDWAPPHALGPRLDLDAALNGRTYTAARLGGKSGARMVVKFFLGSENLCAQNEARAYELLSGTGLTPEWYGVWAGFHPHIGHRRLRAGRVLLLACVLGDGGRNVVVDELTLEER